MLFIFLLFLTIFFGLIFYSYKNFRKAVRPYGLDSYFRPLYEIIGVLYWVSPFAFIVFMIVSKGFGFDSPQTVHNIFMGYLPVMTYVALSAFVWDVYLVIYKKIIRGKFGYKIKPYSQIGNFKILRSRFLINLNILLIITIVTYGYINTKEIHLTKQTINLSQNPTKSKKIVLLTDVHFDSGFKNEFGQKMTKIINEQKADLIFIVGDLIDLSSYDLNRLGFDKLLRSWESKQGVYATIGNHEVYAGLSDNIPWMEKQGLVVLNDSAIVLDSLNIVGRYDISVGQRDTLTRKTVAQLMKNTNPNFPTIMLDHQPRQLQENLENGVDLILSGHTHSGQFFPFNYVVPFIFDFHSGYGVRADSKGNMLQAYVCQGSGTWGPNFRLGTINEIVLLDINY